mmetsp:Transcript_25925/g.74957  ORF Transcript_25925/g.74957 Transcript_25925/m.74957 type:complete len:835 (+) Transcript_25925:144-2648(+)
MGRFHVGATEDDDGGSSPPVVAAVSASGGSQNPNVEAMDMDSSHGDEDEDACNGTNKTDDDNNHSDDNGDDDDNGEVEMMGSEPWQDRCYHESDDDNGHGHEPVRTPPPPDGPSGAVVPYDHGHGDYHAYHQYDEDDDSLDPDPDPDRAAAEELAAQMDYEAEQEEEEERKARRIDTRIRMLWSGRSRARRRARRRRNSNDADGVEEEDDDRRVYGHVLGGSGGGGGSAPPYAANIYGHGYGYYHGGPQQYHDDDGAMMTASYHQNGAPNYFHDNNNAPQPGLLHRLRHSRPLVRYGLLVLSGLVLSYLSRRAPPPPPPHDDWTAYLVTSTHRILGEVERLSHDTGYILGGFVRNVYHDAAELLGGLVVAVGGGEAVGVGGCVLEIPMIPDTVASADGVTASSDTATSYIERRLREDIFGQDRAIRAISRALEAWEGPVSSSLMAAAEAEGEAGGEGECTVAGDENHSETCKAPSSPPDHHDSGKPLTLLLSGPEGTGKGETASLVARLVFEECSTPGHVAGDDFQQTMPGGVLHIDARSYSDSDEQKPGGYAHHQRTRAFGDRIIGHIQKQRGGGAVIIISQIENMSTSVVGELVRMIKSSSSTEINSDGSIGRAAVGEKDAVRWNNVLFVFTSYLGADKMFQLVHAYEGIEYISDKDLTSAARNDVDDHFGSSTGLGNAINTVATFMPLEVEQMEDVLHRKVRQLSQKHEGTLWKRLDVTKRALSYFAGPDHVEYLSMKNRETGSTVFSFSKRGAHTLDDDALLQSLRSARRHISARPQEVAVFDYHLDGGVATIIWCIDTAVDAEGSDRQHRDALSAYGKCGDIGWRGEIK